MSFGDISARFKKKQEETAATVAPVERNHEEIREIRARMIGVLIRDARTANGASQDEVATAIGVSDDALRDWEFGRRSPSLPQLEMIAYFLGIPVSHFWSDKTLNAEQVSRTVPNDEEYNELRNRVIGAKLALARQEARLSREEVAQLTGLAPEQIASYEFGQVPVPFAELTTLSSAVRKNLSYFLEDQNRVGSWLALQEEYIKFSELPPEMRAFVIQHVNTPFIDIAMRLARMPVQELREIGENILNITF